MMYALMSLGQRAQMSRWIDPEETMPLTQVTPEWKGTRETNEDLTLTSFATGRTEVPMDSYENSGTAKWQGGCMDVRERAIVPESVMVENDLYEVPAADECNDGPVPGTSRRSSIDSDASPDCRGQSTAMNDDVNSFSGDVSFSGEGQMSADQEEGLASLTPEDPSHDYDVVYTPRSDAAAMVRRVDSTGYVKSKLQRNHAYEEVRVDRTPPCVPVSPALPPRRTPAASPALPHRGTPVASPALPHLRTPVASPSLPHRRTPAASPALPPRRVPRAMSPAIDDDADGPASPPLPPRGSSRLPATERTTPVPPRRSTSVPSSPVAHHPSPPPIPLPLTPWDIEQRYAIARGSESVETGLLSRGNDTSPSKEDHDYDTATESCAVTRDDPEEHDYDAVTELSEAIRGDLDDQRYSDVNDHGDHRYSATSTDSESNRDNVYEQIGFDPT